MTFPGYAWPQNPDTGGSLQAALPGTSSLQMRSHPPNLSVASRGCSSGCRRAWIARSEDRMMIQPQAPPAATPHVHHHAAGPTSSLLVPSKRMDPSRGPASAQMTWAALLVRTKLPRTRRARRRRARRGNKQAGASDLYEEISRQGLVTYMRVSGFVQLCVLGVSLRLGEK